MYWNDNAWIASTGEQPIYICPAMANRHGLITGASGTGKTTTLKVIAESFSAMGVPVFLSDVKGDLSGMCLPGEASEKVAKRAEKLGAGECWQPMAFPVRFWDIFGEQGHPIRVTISDMGPSLLARLLSLSDVQEGVLNLVFHIADQQGLLLLDMKDLRSMLTYCAEHRSEFTTEYGAMSTASIGAIQRSLLALENQGGNLFFGEPGLNIDDWIMTDDNGLGYVNILNASKLINSPLLYSTFLLWMLSELFERLPEEGDLEIPKMVFFFDEAHLLFNDAPKALLDKVTQIVKLIRSKGVGVYFISQSPSDIPDSVLGQLQNRVQHALHAYTPAEQKAVRVAARTFRPNPNFSAEEAICNLGVGEALVSCLDPKGVPGIVEITKILPPQSLMAPADPDTIAEIIQNSEMEELYREPFDRESAYEILSAAKNEEENARREEEARLEQEKAVREAERLATAEIRKAEREAAALERERRKQEHAAIRAMSAARTPYRPAPATGNGRVYSASSQTTGGSYGRNTYKPYREGYTYRESAPYDVPGYGEGPEFGRYTGRVIDRGYMGNRRW